MNFRVMIAKAARRLAPIWILLSFGYFLLVAYWDWPLPDFLDRFDGEDFHTLVTFITVAPSIALWMASEKLAPPGYWEEVETAHWLRSQRRKLDRARRAR